MPTEGKRVLVTGGGGFIGGHLAHALLKAGYRVRVIDDFSTGSHENLEDIADSIEIHEADICNSNHIATAFKDIDYCLHQAAIPSVPRSIESPWRTNRVNVEGSLNVFLGARAAGVRRVIYASSSSVYGVVPEQPVSEDRTPEPISPYGISKRTVEQYAAAFTRFYDMDIVGLRYFNVFGPRQNPASQYAAVIPLFISHFLGKRSPTVYGDGTQSRDFSYVENVVSANLKALEYAGDLAGVYNIACGEATSVISIVSMLNDMLNLDVKPDFAPPRPGEVAYSCAKIDKAQDTFGYDPSIQVREGLARTLEWFRAQESV